MNLEIIPQESAVALGGPCVSEAERSDGPSLLENRQLFFLLDFRDVFFNGFGFLLQIRQMLF
jgi:hypothetical protein